MSSDSRYELVGKIMRDFLWPKIDENPLFEIEGVLSDYTFDCKYSPDGKWLVYLGLENEVHIVDVETRTLNLVLRDHTGIVNGVAFSPDGQKMATLSYNESIIIYNLKDFSILNKVSNNSPLFVVCFSHCSKYLYSGDEDGNLWKYDAKNGNVLKIATLPEGIWKLKLSADGKHLLTGINDSSAKLVESQNLSVICSFDQDANIEAIDFHPTKRIIAVGDTSNKVKLWNMDDGSLIHTFNIKGAVYSLQFINPAVLFIMSGDGYISSYNMDRFQWIQKIHCGCDREFFSFDISPDRTQLACGRCKNSIKIYSIQPDYYGCHADELVELSKNGGHVISNLIAFNMDIRVIRQLLARGICMNEEEYKMIADTCSDLVFVNKIECGNMHSFVEEQRNDDDETEPRPPFNTFFQFFIY
eukprot:TRINITY_DN3068_c1_g2_i1.p1 TRINITY_DN3068_c1_g2~~TRINITY_DN3068_c1_g2_i1.p1  ORF type:complete len:427 (+),score=83.88 TRINITY_DN3068_c1_g2_i1:40-1281(+)